MGDKWADSENGSRFTSGKRFHAENDFEFTSASPTTASSGRIRTRVRRSPLAGDAFRKTVPGSLPHPPLRLHRAAYVRAYIGVRLRAMNPLAKSSIARERAPTGDETTLRERPRRAQDALLRAGSWSYWCCRGDGWRRIPVRRAARHATRPMTAVRNACPASITQQVPASHFSGLA